MPNIGKFIKVSARVAKYAKEPISKAAKRLVGEEIGGRVVKSVTRGLGDWRYILFEDGSALPVKRMMLNDLIRQKETGVKLTELAAKESEGKLSQAWKSLKFHDSRAALGYTRESVRLFHQSYVDNLKAMGKEVPKFCMVSYQGKNLTMPTEYAEILEKERALKIVQRF